MIVTQDILVINPRHIREGYCNSSHSVCVCVSAIKLVAIYLLELLRYYRLNGETSDSSAIDLHTKVHLIEPCVSFCQAESQL